MRLSFTQVSELASLKLLSHLDISGNPLHFKCSFANSGLPNALSAAETSEASQPGFTALQSLLLDACSIEKLTHLHLSCLTGNARVFSAKDIAVPLSTANPALPPSQSNE